LFAKTLRCLAAIALAASGIVLGLRAVLGPFLLGALPVRSPLNAQSIFGLCITVLLLVNGSQTEPIAEAKAARSARWLLPALLLAAVALAPAVRFPLVFDDYTLVHQAQDSSPTAWTYALTHPGGDGFFRPIAYVSLRVDALWAGGNASRWHLTGLILHLANMVLIWLLAGRLSADPAAGTWAAAVFGIHGTVLLTPTYLAARFDVLAVFFVLAGLVLFVRYLEDGRRFEQAGSLVSMLLGLLAKEIAFAYPLLILIVAGKRAGRHWRAITSHFVIAAAVFTYRYHLLRGLGGYRDQRLGLLALGKGFGLRIWSAFYFPVNWTSEPEFWLTGALIIYLAVLVWGAIRLRISRQKLVTALLVTVVALLPLTHMLLVGSNLLGAGRFYLALAGFAMLMGLMVHAAGRYAQVAIGAALIVFQFAALQHNLKIWGRVARVADATCSTAAAQPFTQPAMALKPGLPREIDGIPFLANGFDACVALHRESRTSGRR
jgi:hypothetical protein